MNLLFFSMMSFSALAVTPPDLKFGVYSDPATHVWGVLVSPPEKHHFNLQAPMVAKAKGITFKKVDAIENRLEFESDSKDLQEGEAYEVSVFLCDDAKTYCVKKAITGTLKVSTTKPAQNNELAQAPKKRRRLH